MISVWPLVLSMYSNDRHIFKEIAFYLTWKSFRDSFVVLSLHFFELSQLVEIGTSKCLSYFIRLAIKCFFVSSNDEGSECFCLEIGSNTLIRICLFHWSHPFQFLRFSLFASLRCSSTLKSDLVKMIENVQVEFRLILTEYYLSIFRMIRLYLWCFLKICSV